jgi:arginyl-tRNA synthetase
MFDIVQLEIQLKKIVPKASLEIPPVVKFGHVSFNGIMIQKEKKEVILHFLDNIQEIEKYEIVGGGFLNIFFKKSIHFNIHNINIGQGQLINVEYCSPNPTGDLHLGHCRNIIIGFCITQLLKLAGYTVISEMYINDQGNQMNQFLETVKYWQASQNNWHNPHQIFYKGEYVKEIARYFGINEINRKALVELLLKNIVNTLNKMHVKHDVISYESRLYDDMAEVVKILNSKNLLYRGQLDNQKTTGEHLILKTSELGLENDSVIQRADGTYTYYGFDIAYHYNKFKRGFANQICVLGEDHASHIEKLSIVLSKVFNIDLKILKYHMFHLIKNDEIIAMSKREGTIVTIDEMLQYTDLDYLRWMILSHNNNKVIRFDADNISINNPLFDLHYVLMRLEQLEEADVHNGDTEDIFRRCLFWPIIFRTGVKNLDTHKILQYIFDLSGLIKQYLENIIGNKISKIDMYILRQASEIMMIYKKFFTSNDEKKK